MIQPNITLRLNNPRIEGSNYVVDAEFKSDIPTTFFGANIRFFYDSKDFHEDVVYFRGFQGGYKGFTPTTGTVNYGKLGNAASKNLFTFKEPAVYINGAIQLEDTTKSIILSTEWTKIFQLEFKIKNANPKPAIVLDLESDTTRGGFLPGSDGIVMAVVKNINQDGYVKEHVEQFNWQYIGNGLTYPFGKPV